MGASTVWTRVHTLLYIQSNAICVQIYQDITYSTVMTTAECKLDSQQTPHTSISQSSYGVSIVRIWEKIDHIITAPQCILDSVQMRLDSIVHQCKNHHFLIWLILEKLSKYMPLFHIISRHQYGTVVEINQIPSWYDDTWLQWFLGHGLLWSDKMTC